MIGTGFCFKCQSMIFSMHGPCQLLTLDDLQFGLAGSTLTLLTTLYSSKNWSHTLILARDYENRADQQVDGVEFLRIYETF